MGEPIGATGGEHHRWAALLGFLSAFWRSVGLTVMWLVACLPLVTAGPATVALLALVRDDVLHQERPAVRAFLGYVRDNAVTGFLLFALTGGPLAGLLVLSTLPAAPAVTALWTLSLVGTVATLPVLVHGYPLAAHTRQTIRGLYRASVILAFARPGATAIGLAVIVAVIAATMTWSIAPVLLGYVASRALFTLFLRAFQSINAAEGQLHAAV